MNNVTCLQDNECNLFRKSLFLGSSSGIIGGLLKSSLGLDTLIEVEARVLLSNWLDQLFSGKILDQSSGDGSTDLELFAEDSSGDAKDLWDLLDHSLVLLIIEEDSVVKLLLNLGLGPGLLLGFGSTFGGGTFLGELGILRSRFTCILRSDLLFLSLKLKKDECCVQPNEYSVLPTIVIINNKKCAKALYQHFFWTLD